MYFQLLPDQDLLALRGNTSISQVRNQYPLISAEDFSAEYHENNSEEEGNDVSDKDTLPLVPSSKVNNSSENFAGWMLIAQHL